MPEPSTDTRVCLSAIQILGEIETDKSKKVLRQAVRTSPSSEVRAMARDAMASIHARLTGDNGE